jgi:hypothetical protein
MIYYKVFISAVRPAGGKELPASFYKNFDHVELFRSNAVKIHFTQ